jgi:dethiobiotin synthetase
LRRLFVTGTDTGVGKTFVTAALARRARQLGRKVFAFKPVETGCQWLDGQLVGSDQEIVCEAAGGWQTGPLRGVYQLVQPMAPFVAARAEGTQIDLEQIVRAANSVRDVDLLLVEGAGGWRVPITENDDMSALARRLGTKVVVVARAGLGTINHSLLTIEAVERDGLEIVGVVLSRHPTEDAQFARSNAEQIRRRWSGSVLIFDGSEPFILDSLLS